MVMADKDDIAKSSFGRNEMPVHSLTCWGWSRFDKSNGLIDKSKKAIRTFHAVGSPLLEYNGVSHQKEWKDAFDFLWQAQDDWADWVISESKAKRMVEQAGAANFKLIDQFEKSRLAKFSKFMKDCAKLSNFLQPTATDNLHVMKLVRDLQVYCPPGSKVTHQPSTKNDAMNDVSQYHIYNAASLSFNGVDNKKATLNRENTEDFSSMPSWIRPGAVFQPCVSIIGNGWGNSVGISIHFKELLFWPVADHFVTVPIAPATTQADEAPESPKSPDVPSTSFNMDLFD